jgi:alpha-tubulin suppressor-like RCC1 family protein
MTLRINGTTVVNTDRSITLGTATPGAPVTGMMRYNSTLPEFQVYDGAAWVPFKKVVGGSAARLYAWGDNNLQGGGMLGDGTSVGKSSPVSVLGGFTDWVSASGGLYHSMGIRANGTLWAWGFNGNGRLGTNTTTNTSSPVSVVGGFTNWVIASTGREHSLGLRATGQLYAWGSNGSGRLGDNTVTAKSSPVLVAGGFSDWKSANAGDLHSLGLRANGTLYAWGNNGSGRLGDNTVANKSSPVVVVGGFTDWVSASASYVHSVGLRANGTIWTWGANTSGVLGQNTAATASRSSPVTIAGGFTNWIGASSSGGHSIALRADGTAWSWGFNSSGRLGDNTATTRSSPVSVVGGFTDWTAVSGGGFFCIGLRANGTLWAWGTGGGMIGDGTIVSRSSPVSVVGGFTDWVSAGAGNGHVFGIRG